MDDEDEKRFERALKDAREEKAASGAVIGNNPTQTQKALLEVEYALLQTQRELLKESKSLTRLTWALIALTVGVLVLGAALFFT